MNTARSHVWLAAARPRTLPAAVAPVFVGSALAWHDGRFDAGASALCLGFALLVQIGTNFANDYYDFIKGADTVARIGPRRAVAAGLISPAVMRRVMWAVFAVAFGCGLGLVAWGGPWPLGYHGLGEVFVFVFFGVVAVEATYFVQAGRFGMDALLAAVPIGLLTTNILLVNNYRDVETDAAAGKRTLVVRFGRGFARAQFAAALAVALAMPLVFLARGQRAWCLLPMALAPIAWTHLRRLRDRRTPAGLIALLGDTGKLLAIYAALFAAGVVL